MTVPGEGGGGGGGGGERGLSHKKCLSRGVYIYRPGGSFAIIVICRGVRLNNGISHCKLA